MKSEAFFRLIAGPVGSGKTTAALFELFRRACEQAPAPDGYRYTRFAIVRQTLKQLKDTVLKDITSWLRGIANYKVSDSTIYIEVGDIRSEWVLIPLDNPEDQRRLLSMQLTGSWMSEAIEMDVGLVAPLSGRCGRYPSAALGGCTWFGIIADTNFPSEGSDWHKFMELETPPDWQIFKQPSGMADDAENLEWLVQTPETLKLHPRDPARRAQGRTYYERFVRQYGQDSDWVKRYVYAQYGDDPSGSAVFRDSFKTGFHVVDDLDPVVGYPLLIGQDFGRDPCSIIVQPDHKGRLLVLEEAVAEDTGLEQHIQNCLRPKLLQDRYLGKPVAMIGDPSGVSKSSIYEETTFDVLKRLGFSAYPAPTNDIDPRIRAVEAFLLAQRDGGPAIIFDRKRCPKIIRAMSGGYRYGKSKDGRRKPAPDKNEYSHIADSLQYACLAAHGGMGEMVARHLMRRPTRVTKKISSAAWT
jgi:DNA polymerase III delta prime subunit